MLAVKTSKKKVLIQEN